MIAEENIAADPMYGAINIDTIGSINRYVYNGIPPGGFVEAVICNDLKQAFARADLDNRATLFQIVCYVVNEVPYSCQGDTDKYKRWIKTGGLNGEATERILNNALDRNEPGAN